MKESGKMLEPQVNYSNRSQVNHDCLKLSFLIKRHCFGDVWKCNMVSYQMNKHTIEEDLEGYKSEM